MILVLQPDAAHA